MNKHTGWAFAVAVCLPLTTMAQDMGSFDPAKMEAMAQQAQKAQECMSKVDQDELTRVQNDANAKTEEVKALCAAGKRSDAQNAAVSYGKALENEPVIKQMQACVGLMDMSVPQAAWAQLEDADTKAHVCDL